MSITDELREWAKTLTHWWYDPVKDEYTYTTGTMPPSIDAIRLDSNIIAIADRIDAEHQKAIRELNNLADASVLLPVDADGEVIHIGDEVEEVDYDGHASVFEVRMTADGWWVCAGGICRRPDRYRHYHKPTVEDVLREFSEKMNENLGMYTGEAIDADEWRQADSKTIAEYAAKLKLAEGEDA